MSVFLRISIFYQYVFNILENHKLQDLVDLDRDFQVYQVNILFYKLSVKFSLNKFPLFVNLNSIQVYQYQIMKYNYRCLVKVILKNKIDYFDTKLTICSISRWFESISNTKSSSSISFCRRKIVANFLIDYSNRREPLVFWKAILLFC